MELILTEWLGAGNEYIKLTDDSILELNVLYLIKTSDVKDIKNIIANINGIKGKRNINSIKIENYHNDLKKWYKDNLQNIISLDNNRNNILLEISKINNLHKAKFTNEDINPLIKIIENKNELYVKTFQYAAEFELLIKESKKAKKESLKIKIEPRNLVSESCFKKILETLFNINRLSNISGGNSNSFLLLYYIAFISRLNEVLKYGLYREYIELENNLTYLKERLKLSDHLRINHVNKHLLYCEFSELTPNNLINQTIVSTLNIIQRNFKNYKLLQHEIRKITAGLFNEVVNYNKINISSVKNIKYNRQNKRYEEIVTYCVNILQNIGGTFSSDNKTNYSAFYVDMNDLFEKYVEKRLIKTFSSASDNTDDFNKIRSIIFNNNHSDNGYYIETQSQGHYALDEDKVFTIKPDFLIKNLNGDVIAIADAKYKRLNNNKQNNYGISSSDVYQLLSYAHKFNTNTIILIYPQPPDKFIKDLSFAIKAYKDVNTEIILHICYVNLLSKGNL